MNSLKKGQSSVGLCSLLFFYSLATHLLWLSHYPPVPVCGITLLLCYSSPCRSMIREVTLPFEIWIQVTAALFLCSLEVPFSPMGSLQCLWHWPLSLAELYIALSYIPWWSFSSSLWPTVYKFIFVLLQWIFSKLQDICAWHWCQFGELKRL